MANSRTKLATSLSAEELEAFCERLKGERDLTGARIQELAAEMGVTIGHNSANEFKNKEFEPWLAKLKRQKNLAQFISDNADPNAAATIADAAASTLSQNVFEFLQEGDVDVNLFDDEGIDKAKTLSLIIQRLRSGDHRLKLLQMKLQEKEEERAKRDQELKDIVDKAKRSGGMSDNTQKEMESWLGWKPEAAA